MSTFAIKDALVFTGDLEIPSGAVIISDGVIKFVGDSLPVDFNFPVYSKLGHTLLPGFIDAHIHADKGKELAIQQALRFGVTTVLDMHNEPPNVAKLKKLAASTKDVADFKSACLGATIENGWPVPVVTAHDKSEETMREVATWPRLKTAEDVEKYMDQNIADGADYIKLMHESGTAMGVQFDHPSFELQEMVVKAAHARGKKAVAHSLAMDDHLLCLRAGVDGMTHTFFDQPPTDELVAAYKKANAWLNPTLAAIGSLTTEGLPLQEKFAHDPRGQNLVAENERGNLCRCMGFRAETSKVEYAYESVRRLRKEGIDIICGSDAAGPALGTAWGLSLHHELSLYVNECGFSPADAIKSATSVTANRFGFPDRGLIAEGRKADLVLVEGNALQDIDATLNVRGVWRDGVLASTYEGKV